MIRVVMFDLGLTLVDNDVRPFAHVEDALTAISNFKTADGKPLLLLPCIRLYDAARAGNRRESGRAIQRILGDIGRNGTATILRAGERAGHAIHPSRREEAGSEDF